MPGTRERGEQIRQFILENVGQHPKDIVARTSTQYKISRQAVHKHMHRLIQEGQIQTQGNTKNRTYSLKMEYRWRETYTIDNKLEEGVVWYQDISRHVQDLDEHVVDIWRYGFTEMFNNAIDHSNGTKIDVKVTVFSTTTAIAITDNGEGIFKKIQREMDLHDMRHSVLELSKGKFTTDPHNHSGEGIFFSSRMFDSFTIWSRKLAFLPLFNHQSNDHQEWILDDQPDVDGTTVGMIIANNSTRRAKDIFDKFSSTDDDYGFTKTVIPVALAQYGDDKLISRSQAKRLLVGIDKFKTVLLDFKGVETIGQAFADEIFRVFRSSQPGIEVAHINAGAQVTQMINRALSR